MKLNWGNILVIAFILFGGMILYLVYLSTQTNFDLVSKEYYKDELEYQHVIDASKRTLALSDTVSIIQDNGHLTIVMPEELSANSFEANAHFYCAYDASKDQKMKLNFHSGNSEAIPIDAITKGVYTLKLRWEVNGLAYYDEKHISL